LDLQDKVVSLREGSGREKDYLTQPPTLTSYGGPRSHRAHRENSDRIDRISRIFAQEAYGPGNAIEQARLFARQRRLNLWRASRMHPSPICSASFRLFTPRGTWGLRELDINARLPCSVRGGRIRRNEQDAQVRGKLERTLKIYEDRRSQCGALGGTGSKKWGG